MHSVASGVRLAVAECQRQFRFRRWNCSTATPHTAANTNVTSSLFGHVTDTGQFIAGFPANATNVRNVTELT